MKHTALSLLGCATVALCAITSAAFGQGMIVPVQGPDTSIEIPDGIHLTARFNLPQSFPKQQHSATAAITHALAGLTIPMWSYTIQSPVDNNWYEGTMVGRSPFENSGSGYRTVIPVVLIPIILRFSFANSTV